MILFFFNERVNERVNYSAMLILSYTSYMLFIFGQARVVISSVPDEFVNGANLGFTAQDRQNPISVQDPGDFNAVFQGATTSFDSSAVNPSDLQSANLSPNSQNEPTPGQANSIGNTALLFDESTGGGAATDIFIPSVPSQILDSVPELIDAIGKWLQPPKQPECKKNKHPVCCQKGAPQLQGGKVSIGRVPAVEPKVHIELLEYAQRRRVCRSCTPALSHLFFPLGFSISPF